MLPDEKGQERLELEPLLEFDWHHCPDVGHHRDIDDCKPLGF